MSVQYLTSSIIEGFSFGKEKYSTLLSFGIKVVIHSFPGFLIGHFLDEGVYWLQREEIIGKNVITYTALQIALWILMFYLLFSLLPTYANEFQGNIAGIFFVTFFFIAQVNFIDDLKKLLGSIDSYIL